jgi:hypothetical protein
VRSR